VKKWTFPAVLIFMAITFLVIITVVGGCGKTEKIVQPQVSNEYIQRAVIILQSENPSLTDIQWIESLSDEQLDSIFTWMKDNLPADSTRLLKTLQKQTSSYDVLSSCWGNWQYEWIEKQSGGGVGCYSDGFTNDWDHRCGNDWPPDKVYFFPCTNYNNKGSIKIWSTDWRSRLALKSGVSARVYQGCVQICVGYWSLYFSYTNPYTLMSTTYIYW